MKSEKKQSWNRSMLKAPMYCLKVNIYAIFIRSLYCTAVVYRAVLC